MKGFVRAMMALLLVVCVLAPATASAAPKTLKGTITGYVLLPNGKPAGGVLVQAYGPRAIGLPPMDLQMVAETRTTKTGKYTLSVPPGTYRVWFVPAMSQLDTLCMEAYPDAPTPYNGDAVTVRTGLITSRVSVQLDPGASKIAGWVNDASAEGGPQPMGHMLMGLCIQGYSLVNAFGWTYTDESGYYEFGGLKPFDWGVVANAGGGDLPPSDYPDWTNLIGGLYDWSIDRPSLTETLNFNFQRPGFTNLQGRLVWEGTDAPVCGALVRLFIQEPDGQYYGAWETRTDAVTGEFAFPDLPYPGPPVDTGWAVLFVDENGEGGGFLSEFYDNADNQWGAQPLPIRAGELVDIGNWQMSPGNN